MNIYTSNIVDGFLLAESLLLLILSLFVFRRNPKDSIYASFALMVFGAAMWVGSNIQGSLNSEFIVRVSFLGAILVGIGFYFFSYYFPFRLHEHKKFLNFFIVCSGVVLSFTLFFTDLFVSDIDIVKLDVNKGPFYHVFAAYFLLIWIYAFLTLSNKYRRSDGIHRWQLKMIFYAVAGAFLAGVTTNLILPWIFDINYLGTVGPLFSIVLFGVSAYVLLKR